MNIKIQDANTNYINWLFLDLNSFFASCEQQDRPELRGKPIAVVQMLTDSTCAIASSYEAKKLGVKTGTKIYEAKKLCPDLILVKARHRLYVDYHNRVLEAIDTCIPVEKICSIDEMACRITGRERHVDAARALAIQVKQAIRHHIGAQMTCSIGLAPSLFLGKVASDMQKPNGLVTITKNDLPHILYELNLTDIYGIGKRMQRRLNRVDIYTVNDLMQASRDHLRQAWGGVIGVLYHELLHGADLQFPSSGKTRSISHQHVLEPELRNNEGAKQFAQHLLAKAAERLRHKGYYARRLGVFISWTENQDRFWDNVGFHETQNSDFMLARLGELWQNVPHFKPKKIGVVLLDLVEATHHQPDLFADCHLANSIQSKNIAPLMDQLNRRYGRGTVGFGLHAPNVRKFTGHAAFQRVPHAWEF